jgi:CubicO group peptidase (beta-lactamase class C family)
MDSLLVIRHGRIVTEAYYAPFKAHERHRINSATKGVTAALVGAAIQAGHLASTSMRVVSFFPNEHAVFSDARKRELQVQHLLDMTSGLAWDEPLNRRGSSAIDMERTRDWVRYVLHQPMAQSPGTAFNYNSGNSQLLSAIVTRATGTRAEKFAAQRLFGPMGIVDYDWNVDSTGLSVGGFGLQMTTRDMAKLGYLYLHDGVWEGKRLLPPGWTSRVREAKVAMNLGTPDEFFYAEGWWVAPKRGLQMMAGMNRQIILVWPSKELVVVTTGRAPWRWERFFDLLENAVQSAAALLPQPRHLRVLRAREEAVSFKVP